MTVRSDHTVHLIGGDGPGTPALVRGGGVGKVGQGRATAAKRWGRSVGGMRAGKREDGRGVEGRMGQGRVEVR